MITPTAERPRYPSPANASNGCPLLVGMVGVGNFGAFRRHTMRETGLFRILAAYDHNPEALQQCCEQDGCRMAAGFEDLLEEPGIEALFISTGARDHAAQALAAMARGLHVFVEKPLCANPEEVEMLIEAQASSGVVFACAHNDHASDPLALATSEILRAGELGKVATFHKVSAHSGGLKIRPGDWRGDPASNPGGMLFQCGVHGLHELMHFFGPVAEVSASMAYDVHTTSTADVAACLLRMESGVVGTLSAYHVTPYLHRLEILGTEGYLSVDERYGSEGTVRFLQKRSAEGTYESRTVLPQITEDRDHLALLERFYAAVREGGRCEPGLIEGARAVAVVFAAQRSAETGRVVRMAEMFPSLFSLRETAPQVSLR